MRFATSYSHKNVLALRASKNCGNALTAGLRRVLGSLDLGADPLNGASWADRAIFTHLAKNMPSL